MIKLDKVVKSILWRVVAVTITTLISLKITGSLAIALSVGTVDTAIKLVAHYVFEEVWEKATKKSYKTKVLWFTGLSGAGKTTLAVEVQKRLQSAGVSCTLLDGDLIREAFPKTGFDEESRKEHIRRVAQTAVILQSQGIIPIVSLISPYRDVREEARTMSQGFVETYVSTSYETCERRDVKGLYAKARSGEIKQFTGKDSPYEEPLNPELVIDTSKSINDCVNEIMKELK